MSTRALLLALAVVHGSFAAAQVRNPKGTKPTMGDGGCYVSGFPHDMSFVPGAVTTNTFVTTGDPELRKFLVYVPSDYATRTAPLPVVYMVHGTGQTAQAIMHNTTWRHAAEFFGFIAVYPEALPYLLLDGTTVTKWATDSVEEFVVDPSELPMADDVLFLRELHNTLIMHLDVDCRRVYASGFSNGGAFVKTELRVELADVFAATSSAGGIGVGNGLPGEYMPANGTDFRPHYELVGTRDDKKIDNCISTGDLMPGDILPRRVADVVALPCMWDPLLLFAEAMGQDPSVYATVEDPDYTEFLWNSTLLPGPGPTEYRFRILPGMIHEYPSGTNHPIDYVPILWAWMEQYRR
ncbi:MAG: PHB depolymerase family esterase [Planctomycetota bacterium]